MAGFAPAYQHESNDSWLDELFSDISQRPRNTAPCASYGRDWDDDLVDDPDTAARDNAARSPSVPARSSSFTQSRSARRHRRTSSPWCSRSSHSRSQSRAAGSSPFARPTTRLDHYQGIPEDREYEPSSRDHTSYAAPHGSSAGNVRSFNAIVDESLRGRGATLSSYRTDDTPSDVAFPPPYSPGEHPSFPRAAALQDGRKPVTPTSFTTVNRDGKLVPRSPTSQTHYSRWSESLPSTSQGLIRATSTTSMSSQFSGFPTHPGVRPFRLESREVLGEAAGATDQDAEYPKSLSLFLIVTGICLSVFIISVNRNMIATAIPEITARFQSYQDIGWYGSAYLLTASAFQPLYGRVYMAFDTKWTYLASLIVFEIGSVICGVSPSSAILIVGRAIQGLGSAGILTGSFVVATHSVPIQQRPILFAGVGILFGVGALVGPLLGGVFTDLATWRWCFYINLPVGGITFLSVLLFFKPQQYKGGPRRPFLQRLWALDWIGNIIILASVTMLFLALEYSEQRDTWNAAKPIGLIAGFGVTLLIFVAWMFYKGDDALIPVRIARQRTVAASCGAAFFIYGGLLMHAYYLPIWFQAVRGDSAIQSGVNMVPYMVVNAFFSLFAGIFVSKNGLFAPPAIIGCVIGTIGAGLLATLQPDSSTAKWAGYEVLVSAGLGMAIQQGFSAVQTALPLHEVPIGTAAVVACQSIGGAIFVSVGNTLLQNHLLNANNSGMIPGVNLRAVFELGATRFRTVVPPEALPKVVALYNDSLQGAFIAAVPLIGCAFLCSLCMEWRSVRKDLPPSKDMKEKVSEETDKETTV